MKQFGVNFIYEKYHDDFDIDDFLKQLMSIDIIQDGNLNVSFIENDGNVESKILAAPIKVFLTITEKCNLSCKHCFGNFGTGTEMSLEHIKMILEKLKEVGVFQISITGGEPLIHSDICEILELVKSYGFTSQITTNGCFVDDKVISYIKNCNNMFRFSLSLEGLKDYHDSIRGLGSYDKVLKTIEKLKRNNIPFGINTVLTSKNIDQMEEFFVLIYEMGIENISISIINPSGRGKDSDLIIDPRNPYMNEKLNRLSDLMKSYAKKINKNQYLFSTVISSNGEVIPKDMSLKELINFKRCGAANYIATIKANGDVIPCVFLNDFLDNEICYSSDTNLFTNSMNDIWNNSPLFKYVRDIGVNSKCSTCFKYLNKQCLGGCPVFSKYFTNNFEGENVFCSLGG